MFIFTPCAEMPWIAEFPYRDYICFDPVWDKQRGLDLVHHFSTAFLLDTLKGDQAATRCSCQMRFSFRALSIGRRCVSSAMIEGHSRCSGSHAGTWEPEQDVDSLYDRTTQPS